MLKKYGKAIEQPRGTLPLHFTVSRRMDNPESKRRLAARALCWVVPCFTSEGRGLPSRHPQPHFPFGSRPLPSTERGLLRKAEPRQLEDGRSRRWRGQRRPRQALLAVCALGSLASGWRSSARLPWGGWSPIPTSLPETLPPSRLSLQSWTQVPKKAMIQDREAEPTGCVIQKKGGLWTVGIQKQI